ncbi:acyl-CoA dehydrogenase family protein [Pseudonocardia xishanensis]|uniref:Acyl-[acyl-carrier-protein] dehydrogenase MbtN n=1 Tax=Pseudonocardia xishanensis TaxID=630995 RepID=A0ABP8S0D6_9PSEU
MFRATVCEYIAREVRPHLEEWDQNRSVSPRAWRAAADQGIVGLLAPQEFGGAGLTDWRFRNVIMEELAKVPAGALSACFSVQDDIVTPYVASLGDADQKARWLPPMCRGELIMAIAMTEPGTGSDLQGIRTAGERVDGGWIVNGAKTFISSGINSGAVITVVRTKPDGGPDGFSLLVVEEGMAGFTRGRKLDKIGLAAQDTAELSFADVFVPDANLLGVEGEALAQLKHHLPTERLAIAASAMAAADAALSWTLDYVVERRAFGRSIADFQNTRFVLAEVATELDVLRAYLDAAVVALSAGELTAVEAAQAKMHATEVGGRAIDRLLQLFGGYGYMREYPIARAYEDARVQRIYGGTNEIMKSIIGSALVRNR